MTTRNRTHCPNQVTHGFDRDRNHDPSFSIVCDTDDGEVDNLTVVASEDPETLFKDDNDLELGEREMSQARESTATTLTAYTTHWAISLLTFWILY